MAKRRRTTVWVLIGLSLAVNLGAFIHKLRDPGLNPRAREFARQEVVLAEGAEFTIPFDVPQGNSLGHEFYLILPDEVRDVAPSRFAFDADQSPPDDNRWEFDWRVTRGDQAFDGAARPRYVERGIPWGGDVTFVFLGGVQPGYDGSMELWIRATDLPPAVEGTKAEVLIRADMTIFKGTYIARNVRQMARTVAYLVGAFLLLLALWAWGVAPQREDAQESDSGKPVRDA